MTDLLHFAIDAAAQMSAEASAQPDARDLLIASIWDPDAGPDEEMHEATDAYFEGDGDE